MYFTLFYCILLLRMAVPLKPTLLQWPPQLSFPRAGCAIAPEDSRLFRSDLMVTADWTLITNSITEELIESTDRWCTLEWSRWPFLHLLWISVDKVQPCSTPFLKEMWQEEFHVKLTELASVLLQSMTGTEETCANPKHSKGKPTYPSQSFSVSVLLSSALHQEDVSTLVALTDAF